jgi:hypothetical protein
LACCAATLPAAFPPGAALAADEATVPLQATQGSELSKKDDKEVKRVLSEYLDAMKKRDYARAAGYLDHETFLKGVEPMVQSIASDSTTRPAAYRMLFGVSTPDSVAARPMPDLYTHFMGYLETVNPNMSAVMARAEIKMLAARRIKDRVHVAYQLTLPPETPDGEPYVTVSAQQMRKVGKEWKILFRADQ